MKYLNTCLYEYMHNHTYTLQCFLMFCWSSGKSRGNIMWHFIAANPRRIRVQRHSISVSSTCISVKEIPFHSAYETVQLPSFSCLWSSDSPHCRYGWAGCQALFQFLFPTVGQLLLVQTSIRQASGKGVTEVHLLQPIWENLKEEEEIWFIIHHGSLWANSYITDATKHSEY